MSHGTNGKPRLVDGHFDPVKEDDTAALSRRLDLVVSELRAMRESFDLNFERLIALHELDRMHRDDVNQRLDAYLTRGLAVEKRVDALESASEVPKRRVAAARKK